jgi:ADP-heptose:LPS heptosyltransferase
MAVRALSCLENTRVVMDSASRWSTSELPRQIADAAAPGVLLKISSRKRKFVHFLEALLRPFVYSVDKIRGAIPKLTGEPKRILVLEYWNLGDIVMESAFLQNLRVQYPTSHIAILTSPKCADLLKDQGLVDEMIVVRVPWAQHYSRRRKYNPFSMLWLELFRAFRTVHAREFDLAFSARADIRENFLLWAARVRRRVGYAFGGGGFLLTDLATPDLQNPHFSQRWLRLLEHVGKPVLTRDPHLRVPKERQKWARQFLSGRGFQNSDFLVAIHPGARSVLRQWGKENFVDLAKRLQSEFRIKLVWFRDPGQSPAGDTPESSLALPLEQFMAVLGECRMFICNDSGPMHIATSLGTPVVAIFGPTEPAWFGPLGQGHTVVIRPEFWCRPCFDYCQFDQPYCLRTVTVDSAYEASAKTIRRLLLQDQSVLREPFVIKEFEGLSQP